MGGDSEWIRRGLSTSFGIAMYNAVFAGMIAIALAALVLLVIAWRKKVGFTFQTSLLALMSIAIPLIYVGDLYRANGWLWLERGWLAGVLTIGLMIACGWLEWPWLSKVIKKEIS